jgi:tRNA pseudouridine55 synthase
LKAEVIKKVIILNKKEGETPLAALEVFRRKKKIPKDIPMTYAGRLDPMASGLLIILIGEECKNSNTYLALPKTYEFEVLFGISTDTYDVLGNVVAKACAEHLESLTKTTLEMEIRKNLKHFKGTFVQKYPLYSSKVVKGKALFEYGREGIPVEAPEKEVHVMSLRLLQLRSIHNKKLLNDIQKRIHKVEGDFRQKEILHTWEMMLTQTTERYYIGSCKVTCGSGTYVRAICHSLGERMGIPALAYSIKRTRIGKWKIKV